MSKQTILYTRVSTDPQDKGYSPETQLEACRRYAERLGYTIVAELQDTCSGATSIAERPKGKELVAMLNRSEANAVIVYCVDRLSRDIVDLLASVRDWLKQRIEVHTCDIGKIGSELDIVLVIKGWQGSDEREKIRERTSRGRNGKARAGKIVGCGKSPYGYRFVSDDDKRVMGLAIVDAEGKIVKLIYHWYVYGDEDGEPMKARAIARRLSEMKIQTPDKREGTRKREAHLWNELTVNRILQNETYAGVWRYGKQRGTNGKGGKRPIEETIAVSVPTIVDRELWEAEQRQREYNKRMSKRNCKHDYLLRSMGKCGECGFALAGAPHVAQGKLYLYYHCGQRARVPSAQCLRFANDLVSCYHR